MKEIDQISRRHFIKSAATVSAALWLGLTAKGETVKTSEIAEAKNNSPFILI